MRLLRFSECRIKGDDFPVLPFGTDPAVYAAVCEAISGGRPLHIAYCDYHGNGTKRDVHPVALAASGTGKWYLVAFCELREDARTFSLRNIREAHCIDSVPGALPEKFNCGLTLPGGNGRFFGVFVPESVYRHLEYLFRNAAPETQDEWFFRFRRKYGDAATADLKRHLRICFTRNDSLWKTRDRLLRFLPPLLPEKERFNIFEAIITGCEARRVLDLHVHRFEWPVEQWFSGSEAEFRTGVYDHVGAAYRDLDFARRYDLSKIPWLSDRDVDIFRHVLEKIREKQAADKLRLFDDDLALFDSKARPMRDLPSDVTAEIQFVHEIPGHRFEVVLYNPEARKRKQMQEKFAVFSCNTLLVLIVVAVIVFIMKGWTK